MNLKIERNVMKIIAHRCGTDKFPELTVDSAKNSLKEGAYLIEMDVHFTLDGIPVISHDADCKFLFGDERKIKEMTSSDFLSLKYKDNSGYSATKLETFMEAGIKNILFHVKVGGDKLIDILRLCRKYNMENDVVFGVGSISDVKTLKKFNEKIKVLAFMYDIDKIQEYADCGADYIRLWEHWLTDENVNKVLATGKKLWIMSGNYETVGYTDFENISKWEKIGVDAVLVNNVCDFIRRKNVPISQ